MKYWVHVHFRFAFSPFWCQRTHSYQGNRSNEHFTAFMSVTRRGVCTGLRASGLCCSRPDPFGAGSTGFAERARNCAVAGRGLCRSNRGSERGRRPKRAGHRLRSSGDRGAAGSDRRGSDGRRPACRRSDGSLGIRNRAARVSGRSRSDRRHCWLSADPGQSPSQPADQPRLIALYQDRKRAARGRPFFIWLA